MTRALLALGSNLGDRLGYLRTAIASLPDLVACSHVYETDPVGGPDGQGPYLNMVVRLETDLAPRPLLEKCQRLEREAGRERTVHWGPRTLDVDIIWIDGVTLDEPDLVVPHPRMGERPFVLAPLADVAPDLVAPDFDRHGVRVWSETPHIGRVLDQTED
jgi:2-amino-4-hydroxy-6-hydroxymethyldihydropteridine diphosphokinase